VSLQSLIVAVRVNSFYGTELRHFHEFLLMTVERGNWLSVRVSCTPGPKLELGRAARKAGVSCPNTFHFRDSCSETVQQTTPNGNAYWK